MVPLHHYTRVAPFLCLLAFAAAGCKVDTKSSAPPSTDATAEFPSPGDGPELPLTLNDGEKWQTDDHTRQSILRMKELVETTPPDSLGRALSGEINRLFEGCKLEGEAHSQLHTFLGELLAHVTGLYTTEEATEQAKEIGAIKKLFIEYDAHFE